MTETELAAIAVTRFRRDGYDVYQEVSMGDMYPTADIVCKWSGEYAIVECKVTASKQLLDQVSTWCHRGAAEYVWALVPTRRIAINLARKIDNYSWKLTADRRPAICTGILYIHNGIVKVFKDARRMVRANGYFDISKYLNEAQKDFCPAGSQSGAWSPFKQTVIELEKYVTDNPGCLVTEAVKNIKHHYPSDANAVSTLPAWCRNGKITTVIVKKIHGRNHFYPKGETL